MTDLDRLHLVHETVANMGSYMRAIGKTTYACHLVAGYLQVLPPGSYIPVVVERLRDVHNFVKTMEGVMKYHNMETPLIFPEQMTMYFKGLDIYVKFMSIESMLDLPPTVRGVDSDTNLIIDIQDLPYDLWEVPAIEWERVVDAVKERDRKWEAQIAEKVSYINSIKKHYGSKVKI